MKVVIAVEAGFLRDGASGVSSLSALSGEEAMSGPEEQTSISSFLGVVKDGARKSTDGSLEPAAGEKR